MLAWAAMDAFGRRFDMCLVFGPDEALYLYGNGTAAESRSIPTGGINPAWYPPELDFLPEPERVGDV